MPNLTDKITNPEAIKLINDIQSGAILAPIKAKIVIYKWYLVGGGVAAFLLIAFIIGKSIFGRSQGPIFSPPDIILPQSKDIPTVTSDYEWIRQNIINYGTELPDPAIPILDNVINLESVNI